MICGFMTSTGQVMYPGVKLAQLTSFHRMVKDDHDGGGGELIWDCALAWGNYNEIMQKAIDEFLVL